MKYALIDPNGRLAEVATEKFPVHESLRWIECADDADTRTHHFDGSAVVPIPPRVPTKEELNAPILAQIDALEAKQRRPAREHILGYGPDAGGKLPAQRLKDIDDAIKALRAQLRT